MPLLVPTTPWVDISMVLHNWPTKNLERDELNFGGKCIHDASQLANLFFKEMVILHEIPYFK